MDSTLTQIGCWQRQSFFHWYAVCSERRSVNCVVLSFSSSSSFTSNSKITKWFTVLLERVQTCKAGPFWCRISELQNTHMQWVRSHHATPRSASPRPPQAWGEPFNPAQLITIYSTEKLPSAGHPSIKWCAILHKFLIRSTVKES